MKLSRMRRRSIVVWASGAFLFLLLVASEARAQGASGTITGVVTDETGGVLPGATVVIRNEDTGTMRELVADDNGRYRAPDLAPGPYSVTASLQGFGTVDRRGIRLTVGREAVVDVTLRVGQIADVLTVVGEAPTVDTRMACSSPTRAGATRAQASARRSASTARATTRTCSRSTAR